MKFLNPFTVLAVCVAAAVSGSKKAVSAVAAAVVGVGLLCSPIESVQAQGSGSMPYVTGFCVHSNAASDYELSRGYTACLPFFDASSLLGAGVEWVVGCGFTPDNGGVYTEDGGVGTAIIHLGRDRLTL